MMDDPWEPNLLLLGGLLSFWEGGKGLAVILGEPCGGGTGCIADSLIPRLLNLLARRSLDDHISPHSRLYDTHERSRKKEALFQRREGEMGQEKSRVNLKSQWKREMGHHNSECHLNTETTK